MPLCGVSYESNLVHGEREREGERYRGREVVKKTAGKEREMERQKEKGERGEGDTFRLAQSERHCGPSLPVIASI